MVLSVAPNATVVVRMSLLSEAFLGGVELEWPEEVVSSLEVSTAGCNLVNKIFNACKSLLLSECGFNDDIVSEGKSLSVDLTITSLVQSLAMVFWDG